MPVTSNQWEFLSGTNDDRVELQGIAIWGSAETALQRYGNGRVTDPALRTGSLNALYKRMIWITDPTSNAFANGNGFEVFQQALGSSSNGPDEQVFASDGTLTSSRTRSISQLVDAAISQLQGHRSYLALLHHVSKKTSQTWAFNRLVSLQQAVGFVIQTMATKRHASRRCKSYSKLLPPC